MNKSEKLKYDCIHMAMGTPGIMPKDILGQAKEYYAYITGDFFHDLSFPPLSKSLESGGLVVNSDTVKQMKEIAMATKSKPSKEKKKPVTSAKKLAKKKPSLVKKAK